MGIESRLLKFAAACPEKPTTSSPAVGTTCFVGSQLRLKSEHDAVVVRLQPQLYMHVGLAADR